MKIPQSQAVAHPFENRKTEGQKNEQKQGPDPPANRITEKPHAAASSNYKRIAGLRSKNDTAKPSFLLPISLRGGIKGGRKTSNEARQTKVKRKEKGESVRCQS